MTIYVLVPMEEGIVRGVEAFCTAKRAAEAEQTWLRLQAIHDQKERERRSDWGTGVAVWECKLHP